MTVDPKSITEETTLGELREQRQLLGVIALQLHRPATGGDAVAVTIHHPSGFFTGSGPTDASAIEVAFAKIRRALLPEELRQDLDEPT